LVAPILGPPIGGFIAHYLNWRWIFFLNVPLGLTGTWLALVLIGRERHERSRRVDVPGFFLCAGACVSLTYGLEVLSWASTRWMLAAAFVGAGLVFAVLTIFHLRRAEHPLFDLSVLRVHTYVVPLRGGSLFRVSVTMAAFLLPLMFQLGFGLDSFTSGLLVLALFAGALAIKSASSRILRRYGFRHVLLLNGGLAGMTMVGCAALTPSLPCTVTVVALVAMGLTRSLQLSAFNSLAFADVPREQMNAANTLGSVAQQLTLTLGVAAAALALRLAEALDRSVTASPTLTDFRIAFVIAGVMAIVAALEALTLSREAGSLVSGHRPPGRESGGA
jgi:MFS family permease